MGGGNVHPAAHEGDPAVPQPQQMFHDQLNPSPVVNTDLIAALPLQITRGNHGNTARDLLHLFQIIRIEDHIVCPPADLDHRVHPLLLKFLQLELLPNSVPQ